MNDEVATLSLSLQLTETKRKWDVFAEASREQPDLVVCGRLPGLRGLGIIKKKRLLANTVQAVMSQERHPYLARIDGKVQGPALSLQGAGYCQH